MTSENETFADIHLPKKSSSIIMVLGVGGAGGNAVNHMYNLGITDVTFMACNTDRQALQSIQVPIKVQLGNGLGAGNNPEKARHDALESLDDIVMRFEQEHTEMVFVTAGMGGGTGTGAAPVIAKAARDHNILTVGIVTLPFDAEGPKRVKQARAGLEELAKNVDSLVVIHNDNISKIYGALPLEDAFRKADDILATAAKGIAELVTKEGSINVDFADVKSVMSNGGMAVMGSGRASGADKITKVTEAALSSPLLNNHDIKGAKDILFNLSYSPGQITFDEAKAVLNMIQSRASQNIGGSHDAANIIWGARVDESLNDEITLTIVATGFDKPELAEQKKQANDHDKERSNQNKIFPSISGHKQTNVINIKKTDRSREILKSLETPAYIRRNISLTNTISSQTGVKTTKISIKDDEAKDTAPEDSNDLFK